MRQLLGAILFCFMSAAFAEGYGYLGVSKLSGGGVNNGGAAAFAAGYQFGRYFAAEVGYFDPGTVRHVETPTTRADHDLRGISLLAVGRIPLTSSLSLMASGGGYYLRGEYEAGSTVTGGTVTDSGSGNGFSPSLGFGLLYTFADHAALRAMWERIKTKSGLFGDGHDLGDMNRSTIALQVIF